MHYRFNEFEFDTDSLLLTKKGEATAIRHTEAKVLSLLLEKIDTVINKDDILSHVWQNKVVSEQVVFQNINHLRNKFGIDSIKTFPKRGYQWSLNTEVILPDTKYTSVKKNTQDKLESSKQATLSIADSKRLLWQLAIFACILIITASIFIFQNELPKEKSDRVIKLAYIPMTNLDGTAKSQHENIFQKDVMFKDNVNFDFTVLNNINTEQFEDAVEIEYPKLSSIHPFVLTGKVRSYKQQTYVDFMVTGPYSDWPGQLSGSSKQNVIEQMQQHLKQQVIYDFIDKPQSLELKQARLSLAHKDSPNDLIILRKLSVFYFKTGELEKAMVMSDKLINLAQSQNKPQHSSRLLS